jgi:hypothetical protein
VESPEFEQLLALQARVAAGFLSQTDRLHALDEFAVALVRLVAAPGVPQEARELLVDALLAFRRDLGLAAPFEGPLTGSVLREARRILLRAGSTAER